MCSGMVASASMVFEYNLVSIHPNMMGVQIRMIHGLRNPHVRKRMFRWAWLAELW